MVLYIKGTATPDQKVKHKDGDDIIWVWIGGLDEYEKLLER